MDDPSSRPRLRRPTDIAADRGPNFLVVGRILGPVGVQGELRARILTDFPERFHQLITIHVGDRLRPHRVLSVKLEDGTVVLKIAGVDDAAAATALRNSDLHIPIEHAVALPPDQFYW